MLLPSNITVFALDFSGSGLSGGEYVSLGFFEVGGKGGVGSVVCNAGVDKVEREGAFGVFAVPLTNLKSVQNTPFYGNF